jgi:hypothetical protein
MAKPKEGTPSQSPPEPLAGQVVPLDGAFTPAEIADICNGDFDLEAMIGLGRLIKRDILREAWNLGKVLNTIRAHVKDGEWHYAVEALGVDVRTANNYMALAKGLSARQFERLKVLGARNCYAIARWEPDEVQQFVAGLDVMGTPERADTMSPKEFLTWYRKKRAPKSRTAHLEERVRELEAENDALRCGPASCHEIDQIERCTVEFGKHVDNGVAAMQPIALPRDPDNPLRERTLRRKACHIIMGAITRAKHRINEVELDMAGKFKGHVPDDDD